MNTSPLTLRELLAQRWPEALADPSRLSSLLSAGPAGDQGTPWFIRALIAISAWIAALLFLVFLFGSRLISSSGSSAFLGLALLVASILLRRRGETRPFLVQLALALNLTGQALLISGIGQEMRTTGAAMTAIVLNIVLIAAYPDQVLRFLASLIIIGSAMVLNYELHIPYGSQVLTGLLAAASGLVWYQESRFTGTVLHPVLRPIQYAVVIGMLILLVPSVIPPDLRARAGLFRSSWMPTTILLLILLGALEIVLLRALGLWGRLRIVAPVLSGSLALAVASRSAPGILAGTFILLLGYHRTNRLLMGISTAFLAVFITAYYYHLDATLLVKSLVLCSTGATLLLFRLLIPAAQAVESGGEQDA